MDKASEAFILRAIEFLELASDQYSKASPNQIIKIKNVIEELEDILEGDKK